MIKVIVKVYDGSKYNVDSKVVARHEYNVESYKVVGGGAEAQAIESEYGNDLDELHEYLVLDLGNGETATFRNTHVDMFRW